MSAPTKAELELLCNFRVQLLQNGTLGADDQLLANEYFLLRWLRARNHNLQKAFEMLDNSMKWRAKNTINHIIHTPRPAVFEEFMNYYVEGNDKQGRPLLLLKCGLWNIPKLLKQAAPEQIALEFARCMEVVLGRMSGNLEGTSIPITQYTAVIDLHGFGLENASSWSAVTGHLDMTRTLEAHYPETLYIAYLVNTPRIFNWLLTLVKGCLQGATVGKLRVYGTDPEQWRAKLEKGIELGMLGRVWGIGGRG